jgi:hypothetical protein
MGLWNCPAHRGVPKARIGDRDAFAESGCADVAASAVGRILDRFNAAHECREVTCLYHDTNWWIENAIASPGGLTDAALPDDEDYFL